MKKIILATLLILATTAFSQVSGRFITKVVKTESMHWSVGQDTWIYIPTSNRHQSYNMFETELSQYGTGTVVLTDLEDNSRFLFVITSSEVVNGEDHDLFKLEALQGDQKEPCSIYISKERSENGHRLVSIFMPKSEIRITFDDWPLDIEDNSTTQ